MEHLWSNWANQVALQQKLPSGARIVLGKLAELADDAGRGVASNQWIIQLSGLSKNTVTRSFRLLQDKRIIWRFCRYRGNLKRDSGFVLLESALAKQTRSATNRLSGGSESKSVEMRVNKQQAATNGDSGYTAKCQCDASRGKAPEQALLEYHVPKLPKCKKCQSCNRYGLVEYDSDKYGLAAISSVEEASIISSAELKSLLDKLENSDNLLQEAHYLSALAQALSDNCQTKYGALVNTFRADWQMFANSEAPFAEVSSLSYELATQNLSKLTAAADPWGMLGVLLKNRLLQMRRQYRQDTRRYNGDSSVLLQMSDAESAFGLGEMGTPLVILEEMPNALEAIRLVTDAGVDESMAFAVTKRLIEIAVVTPANLRPKIVGNDKFLASCGLSSQVSRSWNLFLVGGRGDSGVLGGMDNPLTSRRLQNLLASLVEEQLLDWKVA